MYKTMVLGQYFSTEASSVYMRGYLEMHGEGFSGHNNWGAIGILWKGAKTIKYSSVHRVLPHIS